MRKETNCRNDILNDLTQRTLCMKLSSTYHTTKWHVHCLTPSANRLIYQLLLYRPNLWQSVCTILVPTDCMAIRKRASSFYNIPVYTFVSERKMKLYFMAKWFHVYLKFQQHSIKIRISRKIPTLYNEKQQNIDVVNSITNTITRVDDAQLHFYTAYLYDGWVRWNAMAYVIHTTPRRNLLRTL
jgi:hypothetical protein